MTLQGTVFFASLLLASTIATAQDADPALQAGPKAFPLAITPPEAIVTAASAVSPGPVAAAGAQLQVATSVLPSQEGLPAGVCPVISDYLYQQCEQNPADAMCAPAAATP